MHGVIWNVDTGDYDIVEVDEGFNITDLTMEELDTLDCFNGDVEDLEFKATRQFFVQAIYPEDGSSHYYNVVSVEEYIPPQPRWIHI